MQLGQRRAAGRTHPTPPEPAVPSQITRRQDVWAFLEARGSLGVRLSPDMTPAFLYLTVQDQNRVQPWPSCDEAAVPRPGSSSGRSGSSAGMQTVGKNNQKGYGKLLGWDDAEPSRKAALAPLAAVAPLLFLFWIKKEMSVWPVCWDSCRTPEDPCTCWQRNAHMVSSFSHGSADRQQNHLGEELGLSRYF